MNLFKVRLPQTITNTKDWDLGEEGRTSFVIFKNYEALNIYSLLFYVYILPVYHMCAMPMEARKGH